MCCRPVFLKEKLKKLSDMLPVTRADKKIAAFCPFTSNLIVWSVFSLRSLLLSIRLLIFSRDVRFFILMEREYFELKDNEAVPDT